MTSTMTSPKSKTSDVMFAIFLGFIIIFDFANSVGATRKDHQHSLHENSPQGIDFENLAHLSEELGEIKDRLELEVLNIFEGTQTKTRSLLEDQAESQRNSEYPVKRGDPLGLGGRFGR